MRDHLHAAKHILQKALDRQKGRGNGHGVRG
jgi:hypothetical protein